MPIPWLIHRLTYRRNNHDNLHVRGYKEKGNINTPMELAIENQVDRFTLAMDAIDRVPALKTRGSHARDLLRTCRSTAKPCPQRKGSIHPRPSTGNGRSSGSESDRIGTAGFHPLALVWWADHQGQDAFVGIGPLGAQPCLTGTARRACRQDLDRPRAKSRGGRQKPDQLAGEHHGPGHGRRHDAGAARTSRFRLGSRLPGEPMHCLSAICCSTPWSTRRCRRATALRGSGPLGTRHSLAALDQDPSHLRPGKPQAHLLPVDGVSDRPVADQQRHEPDAASVHRPRRA